MDAVSWTLENAVVEEDLALFDPQQSRERLDQCRLARAVRSQHDHGLAGFDFERRVEAEALSLKRDLGAQCHRGVPCTRTRLSTASDTPSSRIAIRNASEGRVWRVW